MRVLELLEEIEEIVDTAAGFPLTGKIMVDSQELLEIVREIRAELPDEIQQAQWIKNERERIIAEAKTQYEAVIDDAQKQADALVENNDITVRAKMRADELMQVTESTAKQLKIGTYDYLDSILYSFQGKMEHLSSIYFGEMFTSIEKAFDDMLKFAQDCKKYTENVKFTVVDCIGEENVEKSRKVAEKLGIPLRVREYTAE